MLSSCSEEKRISKRSHPKGYAELLERQQAQLVAGIQELYSRMRKASVWDGGPLKHRGATPLTGDILAALDLLQPKNDGSGEMESFEDTQEGRDSEIEQTVSSSIPNGSPQSRTTSSPTQEQQSYQIEEKVRPLAAQNAPVYSSPPPALTIPAEPPSFQSLVSGSISPTLYRSNDTSTFFEDPPLCLSNWNQLLSYKAIERGLELALCGSASFFAQPTTLLQDSGPTQYGAPSSHSREPRIWKRRLQRGVGFDRPDFTFGAVGLSGLDLTAVQPCEAPGNQNEAIPWHFVIS